jgi:hypothetical protein
VAAAPQRFRGLSLGMTAAWVGMPPARLAHNASDPINARHHRGAIADQTIRKTERLCLAMDRATLARSEITKRNRPGSPGAGAGRGPT